MADNEHIGGIAVSIGGEYGKLGTDIDQAPKIAAAGGKGMADAFNTAASGADKLSDSLDNAGKSAQRATEALNAFTAGAGALVGIGASLTAALTPVSYTHLRAYE